MKVAIVAGIGVCLFLWASDFMRKPQSIMSDIFVSAWIALLLAVAAA